jgi:hypothetical protein
LSLCVSGLPGPCKTFLHGNQLRFLERQAQ